MKKTISILLVLVIALSLCACGNANSKYVGTYVGNWSKHFKHIPTTSSKYIDSYNVYKDGKFTYILNSDGTGTVSFVVDELFDETNVEMFSCPISWEVVDEYIYITGSCKSPYVEETIKIDEKFVLEGKDLSNGHEYGSRFRKQ